MTKLRWDCGPRSQASLQIDWLRPFRSILLPSTTLIFLNCCQWTLGFRNGLTYMVRDRMKEDQELKVCGMDQLISERFFCLSALFPVKSQHSAFKICRVVPKNQNNLISSFGLTFMSSSNSSMQKLQIKIFGCKFRKAIRNPKWSRAGTKSKISHGLFQNLRYSSL